MKKNLEKFGELVLKKRRDLTLKKQGKSELKYVCNSANLFIHSVWSRGKNSF